MIGSKGKKKKSTPVSTNESEYNAERFLEGFKGMTNAEIKSTINLVDDGKGFDAAVKLTRDARKGISL